MQIAAIRRSDLPSNWNSLRFAPRIKEPSVFIIVCCHRNLEKAISSSSHKVHDYFRNKGYTTQQKCLVTVFRSLVTAADDSVKHKNDEIPPEEVDNQAINCTCTCAYTCTALALALTRVPVSEPLRVIVPEPVP